MNELQVRHDELDRLLGLAGLTRTAAKRQLDFGPSFFGMLNGTRPPSPRLVRDLALLISAHTGIDVDDIRATIFSVQAVHQRGDSYLSARLHRAAEDALLDTDPEEAASV